MFVQVAALFYIGKTKSHPPIPEHLSVEAKDFLLKCLQQYVILIALTSCLIQIVSVWIEDALNLCCTWKLFFFLYKIFFLSKFCVIFTLRGEEFQLKIWVSSFSYLILCDVQSNVGSQIWGLLLLNCCRWFQFYSHFLVINWNIVGCSICGNLSSLLYTRVSGDRHKVDHSIVKFH